MDTTKFLAQAVAAARANLAAAGQRPVGSTYPYTTHDAAREALQEAHSSLSQRAFFEAIDALGGHEAVLAQIEQALASLPTQWYAQRDFECRERSPERGDQIGEDFEVAGPFATEMEARQHAIAYWHTLHRVHISAHQAEPGMEQCRLCGLYEWPERMIHHHEERHG